jgi:hypothetical protein
MYFNELPLIPFINSDGSQSNVKDIIRRVIFSDESYLNLSNYDYYTVKDTDTPDSISRDFYDNPDYHWIIILYNNAFDPFYTFPLSQQNLDDYINKKYEGSALFITRTDSFRDDPFYDENLSWEVADVITTSTFDEQGAEVFANEETFARIKAIDTQLSKLQLDKQKGIFKANDRLSRRRDVVDTLRAKVVRVDDGRFAVHHFEDSDGNVLNPLATPPDADGVQLPVGTERSTGGPVSFGESILSNYLQGSSLYVVTNQDYEEKVNNNKRQIRIPRKQVVDQIFKEYKDIIRG